MKKILLGFYLAAWSIQAAPAGSLYEQCRKTIGAGYLFMSWPFYLPGVLPEKMDQQMKEAEAGLCQGGCLGFCSEKVSLPLNEEQKKLRGRCRQTGLIADCAPFMKSVNSPEPKRNFPPREERDECFLVGGAACYNSPIGLHDAMTFAQAKLACITGVPAACHHLKLTLDEMAKRKGPSKEREQLRQGDTLPTAPKCKESSPEGMQALATELTGAYQKNCQVMNVSRPYPCAEILSEGDLCSSGWTAMLGCACDSNPQQRWAYFKLACENGRQGIRCRALSTPRLNAINLKEVPSAFLPKLTADKSVLAKKTEKRVRVEKYPGGGSGTIPYFVLGSLKPDACKNISDPQERPACLSTLAQASGDLSVCLQLSDSGQQLDCLVMFAAQLGDIRACLKAVTLDGVQPEVLANCVSNVAGKIGTPESCQFLRKTIDDLGNAADLCLVNVAVRRNELKLCDTVDSTSHFNDCVQLIASQTKNYDLCDKLVNPNSQSKVWCAGSKTGSGSANLCGQLEKSQQPQCYQTAAYTARDGKWCNQIEIPISQNHEVVSQYGCFQRLVVDLKSKKFCSQTNHPEVKKACLDQAAIFNY